MTPVAELDCLLSRDGVVSRGQLLAAGIGDAKIRVLVRSGALRRLREGWFASPHADPMVCRAVTLGGALSCVSALARYGVWLPEGAGRELHLRLSGHYRKRARRAPGVRYCTAPGDDANCRPVDSVDRAVLAATECLDGVELTAVFDSLLNKRLLEPGELKALLRGRLRRVLRRLAAADGSAGSGTETVLRLHFRARHIPFRPQVHIPGVGRVDFLVGRRLVVEADSRLHHAGDGIENDRRRDLALHTLDFLPFRVSYQQVFHQFEKVAAALEVILSRGEHLRRAQIEV